MKEVAPGLWMPDTETHMLREKNGKPFWDGYQREHVDAALKHVKRFDVAVDVGAHVGLMTRYLAERFKSVIAFEPARENYECLRRNTEHLHNVRCVNLAIGDRVSHIGIDPPGENTGNRQIDPDGNGCRMLPLDKISAEITPHGIHGCDFLKIDVQGAEALVVKGAKEFLKGFLPVVLIEDEPPGKLQRKISNPGRALRILKKFGFRREDRIGADYVYLPPSFEFSKYEKHGDYHWKGYMAYRKREMVDAVCDYIKQGGHETIIDIGCGDGLYASFTGAYGIDSEPAAIKLARKHGVTCDVLSVYDLGKVGQTWEAGILCDALEHFPAQTLAMRIVTQVIEKSLYILNPDPCGSRFHEDEKDADQLIEFCEPFGWELIHRQRFEFTDRNNKTLLHFEKVQ